MDTIVIQHNARRSYNRPLSWHEIRTYMQANEGKKLHIVTAFHPVRSSRRNKHRAMRHAPLNNRKITVGRVWFRSLFGILHPTKMLKNITALKDRLSRFGQRFSRRRN